MIQFKKFYIITLMVIIYHINQSFAHQKIYRRDASDSCRRAYLAARTAEKLCHLDLNTLSSYSSTILNDMCEENGCMKKVLKAYENFDDSCTLNEVKNKEMLIQHINDLDKIVCKKIGKDFCFNKIENFIKSNPQSKKDLGMCDNNCISTIYDTVGKGVVVVPFSIRNDIIRSHLLCSKVPGGRTYCIEKLKDFKKQKKYNKKMNIYCNSLCVQKALWKDQSEYSLSYDLNSKVESIIANFTDSACLHYKDNRCGEFLLKILNNDYTCSGLRYPRVFPFSGNYTVCNREVRNIIEEYGPCVNSLFSNKSGDWLNLYTEISRYAKTRRLKNYKIFQQEAEYEEIFNRTYKISNFDWNWYQSNDRAVSVYIINSIAAHLGITPSMVSGQGFNEYSVMIKGLTKKQQNELDNDHTMRLIMFSGQIGVDAFEKKTEGFVIDDAKNILPNILTILSISVMLIFYLI